MKMTVTTRVVILLLLSACSYCSFSDNSNNCTQALNQIETELKNFGMDYNVSDYSNITKYFVLLSGRYINDFGEYTACQNQTLSYYMTLKFTGSMQNSSFDAVIGFCGPINCSLSDAESNIDLIFKMYQSGMGLPLKNITSAANTSFFDPTSPPPGDTATTVIIIIIFVIVILLTVAGTVLGVHHEIVAEKLSKSALSERLLRDSEFPSSDYTNSKANYESIQPVKPRKEKELTGIYKFFNCFDARKNFEKITKVKYTETYDFNLEMFNGIRVFMMLYVVYGHTVLFGTDYVDNLVDVPTIANSAWLLVPYSALYAVDVFFYMSGFLFAYIGVGKLKKMRPNFINFVSLGIHRFLRFWPTYVLAILFFWRILPLLSQGPIWFEMTYYTSLCEGTVWQNLLLLDDILVKSADYCFGWGWYLSNDFQMFLVTPLFLWLYIRNKRAGKIAMGITIVISLGLALWIGAVLNVKGTPPKVGDVSNGAAFSEYYVKPYIRLPPYFIGVLAALYYKEFREQQGSSYRIGTLIAKSAILRNLIQTFGFLFMILLTFLPRQVQVDTDAWPDWFHVTWRAFQKSAYVIAMTMLILPSLLGENTMLKKFLAQPLLVPLARLSFPAYLVHLFWVYQNYYNSTSSFHYSYPNVLFNTIANAVIAFSAGLVLSLIAEIPTANLEATYISGRKRKPANPKIQQEQGSEVGGGSTLPMSEKVKDI